MIKAIGSITLTRVNDGMAGKDAIIISDTAPASPETGQLWQTASGQPIKRWDGSKWVLHYISVENLSVDELSAISANLGTVTAGTIKSKNFEQGLSGMRIALEDGTLESYADDRSASIKDGDFIATSKDSATHLWKVLYSGRGIETTGYDGQMINIVPEMNGTTPDFFVGPESQTSDSLKDNNIPLYATFQKILDKLTDPVVFALQSVHMTCKANGITGAYHTPTMPSEYDQTKYKLVGCVFCNTAQGNAMMCTCNMQSDGRIYIAMKNWQTSQFTINPEYYAVYVKK